MPFLLSASNIGWPKEYDEAVYAALQAAGFAGVEIAPTRIFPAPPYDNLSAAVLFGGYLHQKYGLAVPSMQSIWYGQTGNIFVPEEAEALLAYTEEAFAFAHALHCPSLVFGCPKNRRRPEGADPAAAEAFFDKAGRLAMRYGVRLALEANSPRYTNYLNTTAEVFLWLKSLATPAWPSTWIWAPFWTTANGCVTLRPTFPGSATCISANRGLRRSSPGRSRKNWR